jgi:hypothetical protein
VSPPAPDVVLERVLVSACSEAAHDECVISGTGAPATSAARVTWSSTSVADVEVTLHDGRRHVRHMEFRPSDGEQERWQALGLVVASLVTADERPAPTKPEPDTAMKLPRRTRNAVWIGLGTLLGNGMRPGPLRYGGWLEAGYQIAGLPAFVGLGSSYALAGANANGIRGQWATFSVGGGARLESTALRLLVRPGLSVAFYRLSAQSEKHPDLAPTSGSRWVPATQVSVTLRWPARSIVGVTLGALGGFATGATGVHDEGREVASFPSLSGTLTLGIEAEFEN